MISFGDVVEYVTPDSQTVIVKAGETKEVKGEYKKRFKGKIYITTKPVEGDIYINRNRVGRGEFEEEYYEGTILSVSFGYVEGYITPRTPRGEETTIKANETITVVGEYTKKPKGEIYIETVSDRREIEGEIYIDRVYVGIGSCTIKRTIGWYTVSFGNIEGYKTPHQREILVEEGIVKKVVGNYPFKGINPKAEILSPKDGATVCSDEFIELSGRGFDPDGSISEYLWSVNGLIIGHGKDLRYKFKDMGRHTVTLAVIDNDGLSGEASVEVNVDIKPVIELSLDPPVIWTSEESKLTITIKTLLRQPITVVGIQEISSDGAIIKGDYRADILTDARVSGGSPIIKTVYVGATLAGTYPIKLKGYYWLEDEPNNRIQVESKEVNLEVRRIGTKSTPTPTPTPPGFEAIFAIAGLLALAYLVGRRK